MSGNQNNRETGARAPRVRRGPDPSDAFSQDAARNRKPADAFGNTEPVDEAAEKVRHSDGRNPPKSKPPAGPGEE